VLPYYGQDKPNQDGTQAKRQRSLDLAGPSAKRSKIQKSVSFAEVTKDQVLFGLIDRVNPEGWIPRNNWKAVESQPSLICHILPAYQPSSCLLRSWRHLWALEWAWHSDESNLRCAGTSGICIPNPSIVAYIVSEISAFMRTWLDRLG